MEAKVEPILLVAMAIIEGDRISLDIFLYGAI